jgi:hypothetical protein
MLTKSLMLSVAMFLPGFASAQDFNQIKTDNTPAVVYIQIEDSKGQFINSGTGFIVSSDGYVVTVEHLKVAQDQQIWAVIGQRVDTRLPLAYREKDEENDVALWQLPQSAFCRQSVTLSNAPVQKFPEPALALGFPETQGLTPVPINILNRSTEHDFYKSDGYLYYGESGGPVFNEQGRVVAIVEGGTLPGTKNNDLIPISLAISLINKRGVKAGIESPVHCGGTTSTDAQKLAIVDQIKRIITTDRESSDVGGCPAGTKFDLVFDGKKITIYSCAHACYASYWTAALTDLDFEKITVQSSPQLPGMGWVTIPCLGPKGKCVLSTYGHVGPGTTSCTHPRLEETDYEDQIKLWLRMSSATTVRELLRELSPSNAAK